MNNMNMYFYNIKYFDDKEQIKHGIVCGENYADAVRQITDYFGDIETIELSIEYFSDDSIMVFPDEADNIIFNDNYYKLLKKMIIEENEI